MTIASPMDGIQKGMHEQEITPELRRKGLFLSHVIGFSFFWFLFMDRVTNWSPVPYFTLREIPIYIVGIWLLFDGFGRRSRMKFGLWHYFYLGFPAFYAAGLIYADIFMVRQSGLINLIDWMKTFYTPVVFFIVIHEASRRITFSFKTLVYWLVGIFSAVAALGLCQAAGIAGIRELSSQFWRWQIIDRTMQGPPQEWQARGTASHQNGMAQLMAFGLALMPVFWHFCRRPWIVFPIAGLIFAACFATYSRGGMLTCAMLLSALILVLILDGKWFKVAAATLFSVGSVVVFIAGIYAFDVKRFVEVLEPRSIQKANESISSWYERERVNRVALEKFQEYPMFGLRPSAAGLDNLFSVAYNPYTFEGLTAGGYSSAPAYYGLGGVAMIVVSFLCLFQPLFYRFKYPLFATATIFAGTVMFTFNFSENIFFAPTSVACLMIIMGLHVAANGKALELRPLAKRLLGRTMDDVKQLAPNRVQPTV